MDVSVVPEIGVVKYMVEGLKKIRKYIIYQTVVFFNIHYHGYGYQDAYPLKMPLNSDPCHSSLPHGGVL